MIKIKLRKKYNEELTRRIAHLIVFPQYGFTLEDIYRAGGLVNCEQQIAFMPGIGGGIQYEALMVEVINSDAFIELIRRN